MVDKRQYYYGYNVANESENKVSSRANTLLKNKGIRGLFEGALRYVKVETKYGIIKLNLNLIHRYFKTSIPGRDRVRYHTARIGIDGERVIEIPLVQSFLSKGKSVFELGNVLNNYHKFDHVVVDKYEVNDGVINVDFLDFKTESEFDVAVSISTIEHIGFDEEDKRIGKAIEAINKLRGLAKDDGLVVITLPLGYNPEIDQFVKEDKTYVKHFFKRISRWNTWKETNLDDALQRKYGEEYHSANSVVFLMSCLKNLSIRGVTA